MSQQLPYYHLAKTQRVLRHKAEDIQELAQEIEAAIQEGAWEAAALNSKTLCNIANDLADKLNYLSDHY